MSLKMEQDFTNLVEDMREGSTASTFFLLLNLDADTSFNNMFCLHNHPCPFKVACSPGCCWRNTTEAFEAPQQLLSLALTVCLENVHLFSGWPLVGNEGMNPQYTNVKVDSLIPY